MATHAQAIDRMLTVLAARHLEVVALACGDPAEVTRQQLLRALPEKVEQIANSDRALRPHFRALPRDLREEVLARAVARLLAPVEGLGPESMELLDCPDYDDNPDGDIFAWDGWKLIRRAVGWAMESLTTQHARETALPDEVGSWDGEPCEEAADIDADRLHTPEGQAELVAAHPVIDGLIRDGISLDEAQQLILALTLEGEKLPSAAKVQRLTGMNRRRVRRAIDEIAANTHLLAELQRSIAEKDARAAVHESARARTRAARNHDGADLEGIDRKLHAWTSFEAQEERLTREAIAAERLEQRLAQKTAAEKQARAPCAEPEVDERRARESALLKPNAGVAPGVLRDPNIAAPPGPSARFAEGTHSADYPSELKSAVEVLHS